MMREWARMVLTGRTPFTVDGAIATRSLVISLDGDEHSPSGAVELLAAMYDAAVVDRWHYRDMEVPPGASNDHIAWVRTPAPVVDRVVHWCIAAPTTCSGAN